MTRETMERNTINVFQLIIRDLNSDKFNQKTLGSTWNVKSLINEDLMGYFFISSWFAQQQEVPDDSNYTLSDGKFGC